MVADEDAFLALTRREEGGPMAMDASWDVCRSFQNEVRSNVTCDMSRRKIIRR